MTTGPTESAAAAATQSNSFVVVVLVGNAQKNNTGGRFVFVLVKVAIVVSFFAQFSLVNRFKTYRRHSELDLKLTFIIITGHIITIIILILMFSFFHLI